MKKFHPLLIILMLVTGSAGAQIPGVDTLFKVNELIYFSELERNAFHEFIKGEPDYMAMISAINPNTDERECEIYRDWVDDITAIIREKRFDDLSNEKKIERIEKYVNKSLLVNHVNEADFEDLFRYGNFNYITAAAIYSFILDRFGIPYEIHEVPTHIYLETYPADQPIRIESTRSGHQYFMLDHETRNGFVEYIHQKGVIDDLTYQNNSIRELFQQFYFASYGLSIRDMVGMLYINSAIEMIVADKTADAYAQLEKAFLLHPSYKSQYLLLLQLKRYLVDMDYHNPLSLGYLIKASRLIGYGVDRELIEEYLSDIVYTVLVRDENPDGFMYIYEYLMKYLGDEKLKNDFTFLYLYESGRQEFNDTRYSKALDFLEPAYQLKPDDARTRDLLVRSLAGYSLVFSPPIVLHKIQLFDSSYTSVTDEKIYKMVKIQTYLELFGEAFQLKDGETGELYMNKFEKMLDENPDTEIDNILIGRSYSSAAIYFYRKGQTKKSRQVIETGLSYAPDNIELKLKLNSFK